MGIKTQESSNEGPAPKKWSGICLDCNEEIYVAK